MDKRIKLISLFKQSDIINIKKINNYSKFVLKIINKNTITKIKLFINYLLENYSNYTLSKKINIDFKNTKKITTLFLINKFPEMILTNKTKYNNQLINLSKKIYNLIDKLDTDLLYYLKLIDSINKYLNQYNLWSILDKRINTYNLLKLNYQNIIYLNNIKKENNNNHEILKLSIEKDQQNIVQSITYMNDNNELNFFNLNKNNLNYNQKIDINLYLIEISYRLNNDPPDKLVFIDLIKKTIFLIKECVPNKKDIHKEIDELMDCELMKTYIENNVNFDNYFSDLIHIILDFIKKFHSPIYDIELDKFRERCNNDLNNNIKYTYFVNYYFNEVFIRLNKIIEERNDFFTNN